MSLRNTAFGDYRSKVDRKPSTATEGFFMMEMMTYTTAIHRTDRTPTRPSVHGSLHNMMNLNPGNRCVSIPILLCQKDPDYTDGNVIFAQLPYHLQYMDPELALLYNIPAQVEISINDLYKEIAEAECGFPTIFVLYHQMKGNELRRPSIVATVY